MTSAGQPEGLTLLGHGLLGLVNSNEVSSACWVQVTCRRLPVRAAAAQQDRSSGHAGGLHHCDHRHQASGNVCRRLGILARRRSAGPVLTSSRQCRGEGQYMAMGGANRGWHDEILVVLMRQGDGLRHVITVVGV